MRAALSLKWPRPTLQWRHRMPRRTPVTWSWSSCHPFGPGLFALQIAQWPPWARRTGAIRSARSAFRLAVVLLRVAAASNGWLFRQIVLRTRFAARLLASLTMSLTPRLAHVHRLPALIGGHGTALVDFLAVRLIDRPALWCHVGVPH